MKTSIEYKAILFFFQSQKQVLLKFNEVLTEIAEHDGKAIKPL